MVTAVCDCALMTPAGLLGPAAMPKVVGFSGPDVSMVTVLSAEVLAVLPAGSVTVAVTVYVPSGSADTSTGIVLDPSSRRGAAGVVTTASPVSVTVMVSPAAASAAAVATATEKLLSFALVTGSVGRQRPTWAHPAAA